MYTATYFQLGRYEDENQEVIVVQLEGLPEDPNNYLVIRDIPYLDSQQILHIGVIVAKVGQ